MHKHIITMNFHINKYFNLSRVLEQKLFTRKKDTRKKRNQTHIESNVTTGEK